MEVSLRAKRLCAAALGTVASIAVLGAIPAGAGAAIKLGVYSGADGVSTALEDSSEFDKYISMVGRTPDILMDYRNLTDPLMSPSEIESVRSHGVTPMITWQLYRSGWSGPTISLSGIASGQYDSDIREAANLAKGLGFPVMIRFAHEMNGDWYGWSGQPTDYVNAWRHIVSIFRAENVTNVSWVWSPNVEYVSYPFAPYFPGDDWVDYVALDGYNWGTAGGHRWESLEQVFSASYDKLTQMSSKPVIIAETSAIETGGSKADWVRDGFLSTVPQRFPRVEAVIWFNRYMQGNDWRVNSSGGSLDAYRDVVNSSLYGGTEAPPPVSTEAPPPVGTEAPPPVSTESPSPSGTKPRKKPKIRSLKVTRKVRRIGRLSFRLSDRATVRVAIKRRSSRKRFAAMALTRARASGRHHIRFSGRKLSRGRYRVTVVAKRDGHRSRPRRTTFRVVR